MAGWLFFLYKALIQRLLHPSDKCKILQVRQDIRTFKFELINILKMNDMKTPKDMGGAAAMGKKARDLERKIQKGFNVTKVDEGQMNKFAAMMKGRGGKGSLDGDQIGSQANKHIIRRRALRKQLLAKGKTKNEQ